MNKFNINLNRVIEGLNNAIKNDNEYSVDIKRFVDKVAESDSFATLFHNELRRIKTSDNYTKSCANAVKSLSQQSVNLTKNLVLECTSTDFTGEWRFIDKQNNIVVDKLSTKTAADICYDVNIAYAIAYTRDKKSANKY